MQPNTIPENTAARALPPWARPTRYALVHACARNLKIQDFAVLGLCTWLMLHALWHAHALRDYEALGPVGLLTGACVVVLLAVRGELIAPGPERAILYRCAMFLILAGSYFVQRPVLAPLRHNLLDLRLLAIDRGLFGETPAIVLDRFATPATVEWFAFFYYAYYALLGLYVLGSLWLDSGRRRYELLLSVALIMSLGQSCYLLVPGTGPHGCPGLVFDHALQGGVWWGRVQAAVNAAGANFDIFPSLHTAVSVATALHAVRYRKTYVFKRLWLPTCFTAANIVVATLFLRWHYAIDVAAGMLLAFAAQRVATLAWTRETSAERDSQAIWEPVLPEDMPAATRTLVVGVFTLQLAAIAVLVLSG